MEHKRTFDSSKQSEEESSDFFHVWMQPVVFPSRFSLTRELVCWFSSSSVLRLSSSLIRKAMTSGKRSKAEAERLLEHPKQQVKTMRRK